MHRFSTLKNITLLATLLFTTPSTDIFAMQRNPEEILCSLDFDLPDNKPTDNMWTCLIDTTPHQHLNKITASPSWLPEEDALLMLLMLLRTAFNTVAYDRWTNPQRDNSRALEAYVCIKKHIIARLYAHHKDLHDFNTTLRKAIAYLTEHSLHIGPCNWIGTTAEAPENRMLIYRKNPLEFAKYWIGGAYSTAPLIDHMACNKLVLDTLTQSFYERFQDWPSFFESKKSCDEILSALKLAHEDKSKAS